MRARSHRTSADSAGSAAWRVRWRAAPFGSPRQAWVHAQTIWIAGLFGFIFRARLKWRSAASKWRQARCMRAKVVWTRGSLGSRANACFGQANAPQPVSRPRGMPTPSSIDRLKWS